MELTGERLIPLPRAQVWAALNNIEILKAAIPGCEAIAWTSETTLEATVMAKIGPVKARFTGLVELTNLDPPAGYTISGSGKGGAAGFARGGADITLTETDGGTLLSYKVEAQVGGKLAQIGSRIVDAAARKLSDEFFTAFSAAVTGASAAPEAAGKDTGAEDGGGLPPWAWAAGLAAIVVASLAFWADR